MLLLAITGLLASDGEVDSASAYLWDQHMFFARFLFIGVTGRLAWGIVGPEHARFRSLIHLNAWRKSLKEKKMMTADGDFGHHPQASLSYIGFYLIVTLMVVTGYYLAASKHGFGPLTDYFFDDLEYQGPVKKAHEFGWWFIAFFVVTHVGALVFHEWLDKIPLAQSMISGFQYRTKKEKNDAKNG